MVPAQGKTSLTKQYIENSVSNEVADVLLARMNAKLILDCFADTLAKVPELLRTRASNGLIKAYVAALFANASYRCSQREQQALLRRIFRCRKIR